METKEKDTKIKHRKGVETTENSKKDSPNDQNKDKQKQDDPQQEELPDTEESTDNTIFWLKIAMAVCVILIAIVSYNIYKVHYPTIPDD